MTKAGLTAIIISFANIFKAHDDPYERTTNLWRLAIEHFCVLSFTDLLKVLKMAAEDLPDPCEGVKELLSKWGKQINDAEERYLYLLLSMMMLCRYDYHEIKKMIYKEEHDYDEELKVRDFLKICLRVDYFYFNKDSRYYRRKLFKLLCIELNPYDAALLVVAWALEKTPAYRKKLGPPPMPSFIKEERAEELLEEINSH